MAIPSGRVHAATAALPREDEAAQRQYLRDRWRRAAIGGRFIDPH